jgi:predicted DNA-binding transcriptional regulator AlpA
MEVERLGQMVVEEARRAAESRIGELLGLPENRMGQILAERLPEMLLRVQDVSAITGLSIPTLYRGPPADFPTPVQLTGHARAWRLTEVLRWIDDRPRAPRAEHAGPPNPGYRVGRGAPATNVVVGVDCEATAA